MDELRRLYEHQTMVAIGIYSFLDNLLTHIPPRQDSDVIAEDELIECPPGSSLSNLVDSSVTDAAVAEVRARQHGIRFLPDLSTWTLNESNDYVASNTTTTEHLEGAVLRSGERITVNDAPEGQTKLDIIPGGYTEELFIYLSVKEKDELMCCICYSVLKDAYQCQNEHRFCYGCIYTWSTGPSAGHDGCPVCRCDGLYAKNVDLEERIARKRVRCTLSGCNWMGILNQYADHEHRRYSPFELDVLVLTDLQKGQSDRIESSDTLRDDLSKVKTEAHSSLPEQTTVTMSRDPGEIDLRSVGIVPAVCLSVNSSFEGHDEDDQHQNQTPERCNSVRQTSRRRRRSGQRATCFPIREQAYQRRNSGIIDHASFTSNSFQSRTNSFTSPRPPWNAHIPRTLSNMPAVLRPPTIPRGPRLNAFSPSHHTNRSGVTTPCFLSTCNSQESNRISRSPSPRERYSMLDTRSNRGQSEELRNRIDCLTPMRGVHPSRSSPIRQYANREVAHTESHHNFQTDEDNYTPPRVFETDTPASNTYMAARNELYQIGSNVQATSPQPATIMNDEELSSLPTINPHTALTAVNLNTRPSYDNRNPHYSLLEVDMNRRSSNDLSRSATRPLEFRRLVPQHRGRVAEQLRETREQLSAMLRLMTMELEERRQHVLNATIETAARTRIMRNLTNRLSMNLGDDDVSPRDQPGSRSNEQQNHNETGFTQILRNLRTPERTRYFPTYSTIQRLSASLTNNQSFQNQETSCPTPSEGNIERSSTMELLYPTIPTGSERQILYRLPANRLLTHLRVGSLLRSQQASSVLLVSRQRNLNRLLSELRSPTGWSSEEEDEFEDGIT